MTVKAIYVDDRTIDVSGVGYNREGEFTVEGNRVEIEFDSNLRTLLEIGQLCSNTMLQNDPSGKADWSVIGDPTEGALLVVAEKGGIMHKDTLRKYEEVSEISFDSARKRMTAINIDSAGNYYAFSKGAPEILLTLCSHITHNGSIDILTDEIRRDVLKKNADFAENALRVLALAYKPIPEEIPDWEPEKVEKNMIFVGLVGMIDPPRDEVHGAIRTCKKAGIRPIMITGDHKLTAKAIAREVGLIESDDQVITGAEIDDMSEADFHGAVQRCNVFARVAPEHKLLIVNALRGSNQVVAMTGDGVNDAPAIKAANVGISMGIRGADVTKEASDVILTDDNFSTIVSAVEKGREIYSNIRKFVRFLLAANFDEVFLVFTIIMIGLPLPITAIQILWLNLATDGFPALALGVDPPEKGVMDRSPRKPGAKMMDRGMITFILIAGFFAFIASTSVFLYSIWRLSGGVIPGVTGPLLTEMEWSTGFAPSGLLWHDILTHARTTVFANVVSFELLFVWNCRDEYHPVWRTTIRESKYLIGAVLISVVLTLATIYLPVMQPLFQTVPLDVGDWAIVVLTCIPALIIPPHKIFGYFRDKS